MISLKAKERKEIGKRTEFLRRKGIIPAVLYGPEIKNINIAVDSKEFGETLQEAGESSLITLNVSLAQGEKDFPVLIHDIKKDAVNGEITHVDFYQPILTKDVEATVPLVFEGESLAVKDLGGTLVKEMQEIKVKALPHKLPHEIRVNIGKLATFEEEIFIKDLIIPEGVKVLRAENEIVATAVPPQKVEEELAKPIEEKVEEVEKVEEKKKEKEEEAEAGVEEPSEEKPAKEGEARQGRSVAKEPAKK